MLTPQEGKARSMAMLERIQVPALWVADYGGLRRGRSRDMIDMLDALNIPTRA